MWNLNFLEPSGPLQACNRTDLPFLFLGSSVTYSYSYLCLHASSSGTGTAIERTVQSWWHKRNRCDCYVWHKALKSGTTPRAAGEDWFMVLLAFY